MSEGSPETTSAFDAAVAQQRRAQDTRVSVWVAASAGAGKTRVLTSRILRLLLEGTSPGSILALTYTKAAAKEMAGRLIARARALAVAGKAELDQQLRDLLSLHESRPIPPEIQLRARSLYERILETPGGLQIQTIHAFCQSLLGRFPFEAGLTPGFEAIEEAERDAILTQVSAEVLTQAPDQFNGLKAMVRPNALLPLAAALVRLDWRRKPLRLRLAALDEALGGGFAAKTVAHLQADLASDLAARRAEIEPLAEQAAATGKASDTRLAQALTQALTQALNDGQPLDPLQAHFLTQGRLKARGIHTKALPDSPVLDWLKAIVPTRAKRLQAQRLYDLNADVLAFGIHVAQAFAQEKARRAVLDFDDLITAAGRLLAQDGGPTYVQYRLDQRLEHILLDEAQDTSAAQWRLIAGLSEPFFDDASAQEMRPRSLFVVGDFKQSIFSFQGAEPRLFQGWRQQFRTLAGDRLKLIDMVHSFRSAPAILAFVDQISVDQGSVDQEGVDQGGVDRESTQLPPAGLSFEGAGPLRHVAVQTARQGLVQVWPVPQEALVTPKVAWVPPENVEAGERRRATLGRVIARHIHRLCTSPDWADKGEAYLSAGRRVTPGDFLILVQNRRTDFANALIGELKTLRVPVTGVDRLRLSKELVVQDLMALGEACLQPDDDLALAALLKSPLFGYDEAALFTLAQRRGTQQSLRARLAATDAPSTQALNRLAGRVGRQSVYEFFATYLFAEGGRARLLQAMGAEVDEVLGLFLDRARRFDLLHNGDLLGFLESERQSAQDLKRDSSESAGQVRLMTVHGAKGLEAPIVILPDMFNLSRSGGARAHDQMVELPEVGPIWVPNSAFDTPQTQVAKAERGMREEAERERLLYVALTRAQERLIICTDQAQEDRPKAGKWAWYNRAWHSAQTAGRPQDLELEAIGWPLSQGFAFGTVPAVPSAPAQDVGAALPPELPPWADQPLAEEQMPESLKASALYTDPKSADPKSADPKSTDPKSDEPSLAPSTRAQALQRGTLIHAALEHLPGTPRAQWPARLAQFFTAQAPDVPKDELDTWCQEVLTALADPALARFFGPGTQAEVRITGQVDAKPAFGQIDRLHVDEAQRRVRILDYKTNRPPPAKAQDVSRVYLAQLRAYATLVASLYPGFTVETYLFWTHNTHLMQIEAD